MQGRNRCLGAALRNQITGGTFAAAALGGDTQFKLDFVKTHASPGVAGDFTVGNSAADTNDHGSGQR